MFHSCPHSSPLQCQSSTPVVQCSNVLSFPPFVLLCPFLAVFKPCFFCSSVVSLSVFVYVTSAQACRRTHLSLRAGKSSTSDLSCWDSDPWVSFRGPSKGWFDVYFLPVPLRLSLVFVCVMEDGWSGPPCSSSPHCAM